MRMKGLMKEILYGEGGYIDAGTGNMLIQILIAGFVGGIFMVKVYWKRLIGKVRSLRGKKGGGKQGSED